jgi:hypothetical protein
MGMSDTRFTPIDIACPRGLVAAAEAGHQPEAKSMHSNEYYRLHATCFVMARQSDLADMRTRWLNMAQACLKLANADGIQRKRRHESRVLNWQREKKLEDVHQEMQKKPTPATY